MQQYLPILGLTLIVVGMVLALLSVILLLRSGKLRGSGGAVILIGPIPIVIGSDKRVTVILIALTIFLALIFVIQYFGAGF